MSASAGHLFIVAPAFFNHVVRLCASSVSAEDAVYDHGARFTRLATWVQRGSEEAGLATLHPPLTDTLEIRKGRFGYGLFARRRFEEGEIMAAIPLSHLIAQRNFDGAEAGLSVEEGIPLFLLRQKLLGSESRYLPYVDLLTADFTVPMKWDPSLLDTYLKGSDYPRHVQEEIEKRDEDVEKMALKHNVSFDELLWAFYSKKTRAMNGKSLGSIMYPIFDLALHDDLANIAIEYNESSEYLEVKVKRRIYEGAEIFNGYLFFGNETEPRRSTNYDALSNWGFASEKISATPGSRCSKFDLTSLDLERLQVDMGIRKTLTSPPSNTVYHLQICDTASRSGQFRNQIILLDFFREMASKARSDQKNVDGFDVQASTWKLEKRALEMGRRFMERRLHNYPQSLQEDEVLLADPAGFTDPRVRFMVMLRRDEKVACSWWLTRFQQGLEMASGKSPYDQADESYLLDKPSQISQFLQSIYKVLKTLHHDATEAADQPMEFALVVGAVVAAVQILVSIVGCCCGDKLVLWRPSWLIACAAYGLNAASCRWEMVKFTLDHQMTLVWITAIMLWSCVHIILKCLRRCGENR